MLLISTSSEAKGNSGAIFFVVEKLARNQWRIGLSVVPNRQGDEVWGESFDKMDSPEKCCLVLLVSGCLAVNGLKEIGKSRNWATLTL
jgi:hypothetical protein